MRAHRDRALGRERDCGTQSTSGRERGWRGFSGAAAGARPAVNRPIPLKRFGTVEEIAAMVRLLVGPEGTFITGQTIHVNGGEFLT